MDDVTAPRPLEPDELAQLGDILKSHLKLSSTSCAFQAEADAEDVLNYAFDLIGDGEDVGHVISEVSDLEMEICGEESLQGMREDIAEFLVKMEGKGWKNKWARIQSGEAAAQSNNGGGGGGGGSKWGGGGGMNADPAAFYMNQNKGASSFKAREAAKKDAMEQNMKYDYKFEGGSGGGGGGPEEDDEDDEPPQAPPSANGGKSADEMRRIELMKVMQDRSLSNEDKVKRMEEIRDKYGDTTPVAASAPQVRNGAAAPATRSGGGGRRASPPTARGNGSSSAPTIRNSSGVFETRGGRAGYGDIIAQREAASGQEVIKNNSKVISRSGNMSSSGVIESQRTKKLTYAEQLQLREAQRGEEVIRNNSKVISRSGSVASSGTIEASGKKLTYGEMLQAREAAMGEEVIK